MSDFLKRMVLITTHLFRYHLKDVIVGKIYFLLVRIKIKHMEIAIIKRETTGSGTLQTTCTSKRNVAIVINYNFCSFVCMQHCMLAKLEREFWFPKRFFFAVFVVLRQ